MGQTNCCSEGPPREETSLESLHKAALQELHMQALSESLNEPNGSSASTSASSPAESPAHNSGLKVNCVQEEGQSSQKVQSKVRFEESAGLPEQLDQHVKKETGSSPAASTQGLGTSSVTKFHRSARRTRSLQQALSRIVGRGSNRPDAKTRSMFWNTNLPDDYCWLEAPMWCIAKNESCEMICKDLATGKGLSPLFFVAGACPNTFCGMQAVMYSAANGSSTDVDFWWVKPLKDDKDNLESNTLCRHSKGPHKNDPGRSKSVYQPIADLFRNKATMNGLRFGIDHVKSARLGKTVPRAFIEQSIEGEVVKLWLTLVWQEEWTQNPFARTKYVKGKLVYQKDVEDLEFCTKAYSIVDGMMSISPVEDAPFSTPLPAIDVKCIDGAP
eukprot:TRINITY_DN66645_c0_g1_i1.p1 TRINITY_DN66645_c0_g1~~TRINITY_DN66645_c0_g1_i1.p1  ORF type:complete len:386 (-),score=71.52 TRINITY_DN66645_c0_g1_i1:70-1227(-)